MRKLKVISDKCIINKQTKICRVHYIVVNKQYYGAIKRMLEKGLELNNRITTKIKNFSDGEDKELYGKILFSNDKNRSDSSFLASDGQIPLSGLHEKEKSSSDVITIKSKVISDKCIINKPTKICRVDDNVNAQSQKEDKRRYNIIYIYIILHRVLIRIIIFLDLNPSLECIEILSENLSHSLIRSKGNITTKTIIND